MLTRDSHSQWTWAAEEHTQNTCCLAVGCVSMGCDKTAFTFINSVAFPFSQPSILIRLCSGLRCLHLNLKHSTALHSTAQQCVLTCTLTLVTLHLSIITCGDSEGHSFSVMSMYQSVSQNHQKAATLTQCHNHAH